MSVGQPSAYEPYKHTRDADDDNPEKPLVRDAMDDQNRMKARNARRQGTRGAPHVVRAILRTIVLLVAITILAVQGHSMFVWLDTRHQTAHNPKTGLRTTLWAHLDPGPTWIMLVAALIATVVHFLALLTLCLPFRHLREGSWHSLCVYLTSGLLIAVWFVAVVYFKLVDSKGADKKHWYIWSWSCYRRTHNPSLGKIPWKALCIESTYTFFASIVVAVLEIIGLFLFVISQRNIKTQAIYRQVQSAWN